MAFIFVFSRGKSNWILKFYYRVIFLQASVIISSLKQEGRYSFIHNVNMIRNITIIFRMKITIFVCVYMTHSRSVKLSENFNTLERTCFIPGLIIFLAYWKWSTSVNLLVHLSESFFFSRPVNIHFKRPW